MQRDIQNNKMGKTRDLFKKIRDTKGTFHAKMGTIKNRNSMGLTEAEDIKKSWQNTQKNYAKKKKKILMTQTELEVKWALGSISTNKASGGDGIPVELFQIQFPTQIQMMF